MFWKELLENIFLGSTVLKDSLYCFFLNNVSLLWIQILVPLFSIVVVFILKFVLRKNTDRIIWEFSFWMAMVSFFTSCLMVVFYNESSSIFQYNIQIVWDSFLNIRISLGLDGISCLLILLTNFLLVVCILLS